MQRPWCTEGTETRLEWLPQGTTGHEGGWGWAGQVVQGLVGQQGSGVGGVLVFILSTWEVV